MEWYVKQAIITSPNEVGFPQDVREIALKDRRGLPGVPDNKIAPTWNRKRRRKPIDWSRVPHQEDAKRPNGAAQQNDYPMT